MARMSSTATRLKIWIIPLALVALTVVVYLPVLWSDFVEIDDWSYVYKNIHINTGLQLSNVLWGWTHILGGNNLASAHGHVVMLMLDCQPVRGESPLASCRKCS